jgi:hypothetical protein
MTDLELVEAFELGARQAYREHGIGSFSLPHYFATLAGVRAAIAAAARQGGDVKQAPGEAPESGAEGNRPDGPSMNAEAA